MGVRRKARECALQILFQIDMTGDDERRVRRRYWESSPQSEAVVDFADRLVTGTMASRERIDTVLERVAANWTLERMARVDRSVLRMAVHELLDEPDTPPKVVINEAIEITKKFSSEESSGFVNGILDAVLRERDALAPPRLG